MSGILVFFSLYCYFVFIIVLQNVGLNAGYFLSFTIFLALNSAEFCNKYLRYEPAEKVYTNHLIILYLIILSYISFFYYSFIHFYSFIHLFIAFFLFRFLNSVNVSGALECLFLFKFLGLDLYHNNLSIFFSFFLFFPLSFLSLFFL